MDNYHQCRENGTLNYQEDSVQRHQTLIETYRQADVDYRLSLFLGNPSLRDSFIQIDQGDYERKQYSTKAKISRIRKMWNALDPLTF